MKRTLYAIWIGIGLIVSAIWTGDDCSDNEADKVRGAAA